MGPGPISHISLSSYKDEIATLPSVTRNDIVKVYIAFILSLS